MWNVEGEEGQVSSSWRREKSLCRDGFKGKSSWSY